MRRLLAFALLAIPLLAGCADGGDGPGCEGEACGQQDPPCMTGGVECEDARAPGVSARAVLDEVKSFSEAYPYRQSGTPMHLGARDYLAAELETAGLTVVRQAFAATARGATGAPYEGENVIGVKWGLDRDNWIVVGAHYDVDEGAVFGAYDDGSGTIETLALARAFANVTTHRTLAFILFDQEERGLVGSRHFVQSVLSGQWERENLTGEGNVTLAGMVDLDMVGILWPHPAPLVVWENSPTLEAWAGELANATGMPSTAIEFRGSGVGSSDGVAFMEQGIATAYMFSDWDEVVLPDGTAIPQLGFPTSYPFWHRADTYETMVLMAGDEATLEAGFQTLLDVVSPLLARMASPAFVPDPESE